MRKIPTLFRRDPEDRARLVPEVTPGCEWVLAGEGEATRKYDGTCVLFGAPDGGPARWWARREVRRGRPTPAEFAEEQADEVTGKRVGWEPMAASGFARFLDEALARWPATSGQAGAPPAGTYELCGPRIQRNPEGFEGHTLVRHDDAERVAVPSLTFDGIREVVARLAARGWEGLVWHHPDGRRAKVKARDVGVGVGHPSGQGPAPG